MNNKESLRQRGIILEDALFHLADSELNESLIFQGGGALHFIYSSPRYSDDIDFVDFTIKEDADAYLTNLKSIGGKYPINRIKFMPQKVGVKARWGYEENKPLARVEIEKRAADDYDRSQGKYNLLVKTPEDIYKDKIFANIVRYVTRKDTQKFPFFPFKPNDFFDLEYITKQLGVKPVPRKEILKRAKAYDMENIVNNENLTEMTNLIIDEQNHNLFKESIRKTTLPDVYSLFDFNSKYFKKIAEHFENYKV